MCTAPVTHYGAKHKPNRLFCLHIKCPEVLMFSFQFVLFLFNSYHLSQEVTEKCMWICEYEWAGCEYVTMNEQGVNMWIWMSRVSQYAIVPLFLSLVASTNDHTRPSSVLWYKCFYNCMVMCFAYFKAFYYNLSSWRDMKILYYLQN